MPGAAWVSLGPNPFFLMCCSSSSALRFSRVSICTRIRSILARHSFSSRSCSVLRRVRLPSSTSSPSSSSVILRFPPTLSDGRVVSGIPALRFRDPSSVRWHRFFRYAHHSHALFGLQKPLVKGQVVFKKRKQLPTFGVCTPHLDSGSSSMPLGPPITTSVSLRLFSVSSAFFRSSSARCCSRRARSSSTRRSSASNSSRARRSRSARAASSWALRSVNEGIVVLVVVVERRGELRKFSYRPRKNTRLKYRSSGSFRL